MQNLSNPKSDLNITPNVSETTNYVKTPQWSTSGSTHYSEGKILINWRTILSSNAVILGNRNIHLSRAELAFIFKSLKPQ